PILEDLGLRAGEYAVLTLHRPSNVDNPVIFGRLLDPLEVIQRDLPIVFPVHPRTRKNMAAMGLGDRIAGMKNLRLIDPAGYLDFLKLTANARLVLTDSGGIQEETTILKVPCITLRENTERPVTVEVGSNQLVGTDPSKIIEAYQRIINGQQREPQVPPLWDGRAAQRIADILARALPQ
ncbi:MAG: UDP-N-acetylglucosamine 2-epimerase, partial [Planctomycetota bacterium]